MKIESHFSLSLQNGLVKLAAVVCVLAAFYASAVQADPIRGAGSTFAAPIINQWSRDYEARRTDGGDFTSPDWQVDYEPVGSLAGIMRLDQPEMDFAATDAPLPAEDVAKRNVLQFPIVMGGIVVVANIEGIGAGQLKLSGPLLADIYLGKITDWSDPAIKVLNPGLTLPTAPIAVLHRTDGSGSTLTFSTFLAATSDEWKNKVGADAVIAWPTGRGDSGTARLSALAQGTPNSIAYLEYGQVVRLGLPYASLQNAAGAFVRPEPKSFEAGLPVLSFDEKTGFAVKASAASDADGYPMTVVTYAVIPRERGELRIGRVMDLFRLAHAEGAAQASALGYVPVSKELAKQVEAYWAASLNAPNN